MTEESKVFYFKIRVVNELEGGIKAPSKKKATESLNKQFKHLEGFEVISVTESTEEAIQEILEVRNQTVTIQ